MRTLCVLMYLVTHTDVIVSLVMYTTLMASVLSVNFPPQRPLHQQQPQLLNPQLLQQQSRGYNYLLENTHVGFAVHIVFANIASLTFLGESNVLEK